MGKVIGIDLGTTNSVVYSPELVLTEAMRREPPRGTAAGAGTSGEPKAGPAGDVVDAEFEDVDDRKTR